MNNSVSLHMNIFNFFRSFWWFLLFITVTLLTLLIAPERGIYLFSDDGLFLRMAWDVANGHGWDRMLPQTPSYLSHALLMKSGISEILHFRYIYIVFGFLSAFIFFWGLDDSGFKSMSLPASILASILVPLNSVLSPNSLTINFFLIGAGLYFIYLNRHRSSFDRALLFTSAVFLGITGFMHVGSALAISLLVALASILHSKTIRYYFLIIYFSVLICLWTWYISSIGMSTFFTPPVAHRSDIFQIIKRAALLLYFWILPILPFGLLLLLSKKWVFQNYARVYEYMSWLFLLLALISVTAYALDVNFKFPGAVPIWQVPGVVFYSFVMLVFCFFIYFFQYCSALTLRLYDYRGVFGFINQPLSYFKQNTHAHKLIFSITGFILLSSSLAIGSNTEIIQGFVFFAGPIAGFLFYFWTNFFSGKPLRPSYFLQQNLMIFGWIIVFFIFAFKYNHPSAVGLFSSQTSSLQQSPARGIKVNLAMHNGIHELKEIYTNNNCSTKNLLVLDYAPMLHYLFAHPAANDIGVIRPAFYYPEEKIFSLLKKPEGWCVIDITGEETNNYIVKNYNIDLRSFVRSYLKEKSKIFKVNSLGDGVIGDIYVYVST